MHHSPYVPQVVEKDLLIQEKEKLYMELKNILARQPGPEVAEQLSIYQANLREKTKQMKAMASELNMYQAQVRLLACWPLAWYDTCALSTLRASRYAHASLLSHSPLTPAGQRVQV